MHRLVRITSRQARPGSRLADQRLRAKEPIFSFWLDGTPFAVAHRRLSGGALYEAPEAKGRLIFLHRAKRASLFDSTIAYLVDDTYWYNWVSINTETKLLE